MKQLWQFLCILKLRTRYLFFQMMITKTIFRNVKLVSTIYFQISFVISYCYYQSIIIWNENNFRKIERWQISETKTAGKKGSTCSTTENRFRERWIGLSRVKSSPCFIRLLKIKPSLSFHNSYSICQVKVLLMVLLIHGQNPGG